MGFETSGPNEAMVVSGCGYESPCMIPGGRVWVWPVIQDSFNREMTVMIIMFVRIKCCINL